MEATRDLLEESGRILRKDAGTRDPFCPLATSAHLDAVTQLVREAKAMLEEQHTIGQHHVFESWLKEAEKVL